MEDTAITLLLVDDDDVDVEAVQRALKHARIANPVVRARDGVEALDILRGTGGQEQITSPYLILLDLQMPRMNGFQVLEQIREDERLRTSVVFVLTTSQAERDRLKAYEQHVAGYIAKSNAGADFSNLVEMLRMYWRIVEFPPVETAV